MRPWWLRLVEVAFLRVKIVPFLFAIPKCVLNSMCHWSRFRFSIIAASVFHLHFCGSFRFLCFVFFFCHIPSLHVYSGCRTAHKADKQWACCHGCEIYSPRWTDGMAVTEAYGFSQGLVVVDLVKTEWWMRTRGRRALTFRYHKINTLDYLMSKVVRV